jgi:hypothetical protein
MLPVPHLRDIADLSELLTFLETEPRRCLVRGEPTGSVENVRRTLYADDRSPATLREAPQGVQWVMLDFDSVPVASLGLTSNQQRLDHLVSMLPECFQGVSYHYQWSSGAGLQGWGNYLSAHLSFWLSEPWRCTTLRERFRDGDFKGAGVDSSLFTANQIHYTAAPIFDGCADPLQGVRSGVVMGAHDEVTLPAYVRPIEPAPPFTPFEHNRLFPNVRFEELLGEIGPGYHAEIRRAVAHYVSVTPPEAFDRQYLLTSVTNAIHAAPPGRNPKRDYLCPRYLNRLLAGARRKFGRVQ